MKYPSQIINCIKLYFNGYIKKSYSQEGEDLILKRIFEDKRAGFYIDIGAHHPIRFSNTYLFYKNGWKGINLDAMPNSMKLFQKYRPRDINLEIPISEKNELLTYYFFNDSALNGFSKELSQTRSDSKNYRIISQKSMETKPLSEVLDKYLPQGQSIDFLSIDVEGLDFYVLKSNNWQKYRPEIVLMEINGKTYDEVFGSEIAEYLRKKGYDIFAKTFNTVFLKKKEEFLEHEQ